MTISGSDFSATLDARPTPARERALLDAVRSGLHLPPVWLEVPTAIEGHEGRLFVAADALRIGHERDALRVSVAAATAQHIADHLGTVLPTSHICDLVWSAANVRLTPSVQSPDAEMAFTHRMVRHSREVEDKLGCRRGLVANVGKHWVLSNRLAERPGTAANYGWFRRDGSPIQTLGTRHDVHHVDYSQVVRLVRRDMIVDGAVRDIEEVGREPELAPLVSSEGVLSVWRVVPSANADTLAPPSANPDDPATWRELRRGVRGTDAAAWQRVLMGNRHNLSPWNDDGDFGTATHNATLAWQRARGLPVTGVVDAITIAAIGTPPAPAPSGPLDVSSIPFVAAKNYTPAARTQVDVVVIHTMEATEASTTAERVAAWGAGPNAPQASWHYAIDDDTIVQSVREEDIAWAAPSRNHNGIQLEHAGYARQTAEEWADPFSSRMLERSARLTAAICRRWDIPVRFVSADGLRRDERGVTTHHEVTKGPGRGRTWHTDPGEHFPMARYLELVAGAQAELDDGS
jgi:N-acetyl-anhydromuramyl-L-alanine amidase AmpD